MDTMNREELLEELARQLGVDPIRALATVNLYWLLSREASQLDSLTQPQQDFLVNVYAITNNGPTFLLHHDILLSSWKKLFDALSSVPANKQEQGYIRLDLCYVQLNNEVSDLLLDSFKTAPLEFLVLSNNQLGSDGFKFVVKALANKTLKALQIDSNRIESKDDAASLVTAASNHGSIDALLFVNCDLGMNNAVMKAIVPALDAIETISLKGNQIGSYGVKLIAEYLAKNPTVRKLYLNYNLINDNDAEVLAGGLMTNKNLRYFDIIENPISDQGIRSLLSALVNECHPLPVDLSNNHISGVDILQQFYSALEDACNPIPMSYLPLSLDTVHNSNHTCKMNIDLLNMHADPKTNRIIKLLSLLVSTDEHYTNMQYLDDMPVEIMPRVIAFIMEHSPETRKHNDVFMLMREWSLPLLYTSSVGPELRRSERIRKNTVMQLMKKGKK